MSYDAEAKLPSSHEGPGDAWLARACLPLYVGEVDAVILDSRGRGRILVLDDGIAFAIPADMAGAAWSRLCRGDMVCIRHGADWVGDMLAIASLDTMDGQTSIASAALGQDNGRPRASPASARSASGPGVSCRDTGVWDATGRSSGCPSRSVSHHHV